MNQVDISVVVPVFNEEQSINPFLDRVIPVLENIGTYEIIFSADPCTDRTLEIIEFEATKNSSVGLISFSRRFGQPTATLVGIQSSSGKSCLVIDVDLQDPPELISDLHKELCKGYDVVYAQRISRKGETLVKRFVSWIGYKVINRVSEINIPKNTGDFRIMNRRVVEQLCRFNESNAFLRGLVAYIGFNFIASSWPLSLLFTFIVMGLGAARPPTASPP